ncbi:hypothetical protein BD626DRAFT_403449, partial [Schizophyllum amplum]
RMMRAIEGDYVVTWPERIMCGMNFLDSFFELDLLMWGSKAKDFVYMHDPEDTYRYPEGNWWDFTGEKLRDFLWRQTLPPFVSPTKLVEYVPLPCQPNINCSIGPRPVKGLPIVEDLVKNLTARDLAYATAGSLVEPVNGKTYTFAELYPPSEFAMLTIEEACRINGLSQSKTRRFCGLSTSPYNTPVVTPRAPLTALPCLAPWSPELPWPPSSGIPRTPETPPQDHWATSSTMYESSPLPELDFGSDSGGSHGSSRNWKTGQRVECAPGAAGPVNALTLASCSHSSLTGSGSSRNSCAYRDPLPTTVLPPPLNMASRKPGARPRDLGYGHDFDLRTDDTARPNHLSFTLSADGRRLTGHAEAFHMPSAKKMKFSELRASHSSWNPIEDADEADIAFDYATLQEQDVEQWDSEVVQCEVGDKRKRQTDPMRTWRDFSQQQYLNEMMWGEGLRGSGSATSCFTCGASFSSADQSTTDADMAERARILCCWDCGDFNECVTCCLSRHECMPLHTIEEWTGSFWTKTSLAALGLVYQLGHGGRPCGRPDPLVRTITVLDSCVHSIRMRFCGCRLGPAAEHTTQMLRNRWYPATSINPETCATFAALDRFRLASVHANVNTHGYIKMLEMATDALGLVKVPRAGRGNAPSGIAGTAPGEVAVRCWSCPRAGVNLPPDWEKLSDREKYRFRTILAMDANFRLKNRIRKNENTDSALSEGLGYFVETAPYKTYLLDYVKESDISSCIAFAALAEKDTKITKGLRVSGVGGVICARHEILQPHGLVDLQKGERYCNMDYALCSVLSQLDSPLTTCSYDIGCQYMTNFYERTKKLPELLRPDPLKDLRFGLPVWHGAIHEEMCRSQHSLKYHEVGRTDGEGIERIWSLFNPCAWATKEMGEGTRHDWLEDKGDSVNFLKNVQQVSTLSRRLVIAIDERSVQIKAFKRVNANVEKDQLKGWKAAVRRWRQDPSGRSPFAMPETHGVSEIEVRRLLDAEEMEEVKQGRAVVYSTSQTAFLSAGLQLEAAQRRIMADIQGPAVIPMNLEGLINNRRRALMVKKENFEDLQKIYMPGTRSYIEAIDGDVQRVVEVEHQKIFMPSDFPANIRRMSCAEGVPEKELKLREAVARDKLHSVRRKLHAKQYHIEWRNKHVVGQKQSTRARALVSTLQESIELDVAAYSKARAAILALRNVTEADDFPPLLKGDLQLEGEELESDATAIGQMARASSSSRPRHIHVSTGKHQMSWIWTARGAPSEEDEASVLETVRCLWAKALARKERWEEEVNILQEDMRRCLRTLEWESTVWRTRASQDLKLGEEHGMGARAYALRHADQCVRLRDHFKDCWDKPIGKSKRRIFEDNAGIDADFAASLAAVRTMLRDDDDDGGEDAAVVPAGEHDDLL